eukprot:458293-Prymnesium_polylepis.2
MPAKDANSCTSASPRPTATLIPVRAAPLHSAHRSAAIDCGPANHLKCSPCPPPVPPVMLGELTPRRRRRRTRRRRRGTRYAATHE